MDERYIATKAELQGVADSIRTKGGTTAPLEWPDGYKAAVDAISGGKPEQEKTVTITANGTTEVTADPGKTISKVTAVVNVPVPPEIVTLVGGDPVKTTVENLQANIDKANLTTGKTDADVTAATQSLVDGYGGGSADQEVAAVVNNTLKTLDNDFITEMPPNKFYGALGLERVRAINLNKTVGNYAFGACPSLRRVEIPNATSLSTGCFGLCEALSYIDIRFCGRIDSLALSNCPALKTVILPTGTNGRVTEITVNSMINSGYETLDVAAESIQRTAFKESQNFATLVLRYYRICTLENSNAFDGTKITAATGSIYVPDTLVDQYKAASNWSVFATQIKPLSTLPPEVTA